MAAASLLAPVLRALKKLLNELEEMDLLNPANITSALLIRAEIT